MEINQVNQLGTSRWPHIAINTRHPWGMFEPVESCPIWEPISHPLERTSQNIHALKFQFYLRQQEFWLNPIVVDGSWWWLRAPKSRNIQKGLLKDLNLEVAWDFHWKLYHVLSCANVWVYIYWYIYIYIYICTVYITYMYIYNHVHTFITDVGKWGVLGSADDDIAFFLHILTCFIVHGKICLQVTSNSGYLQYMEDTGRSKIR